LNYPKKLNFIKNSSQPFKNHPLFLQPTTPHPHPKKSTKKKPKKFIKNHFSLQQALKSIEQVNKVTTFMSKMLHKAKHLKTKKGRKLFLYSLYCTRLFVNKQLFLNFFLYLTLWMESTLTWNIIFSLELNDFLDFFSGGVMNDLRRKFRWK